MLKNIILSFLIVIATFGYFTSGNHPIEYKQSEIKPILHSKDCLKEALYFECRNCSSREQEAILDVLLNRVRSDKFPNDICKVVQQPKQLSYRNKVKNLQIILPKLQDIPKNLDREALLEIEKIVDSRINLGIIKENKVLHQGVFYWHLKGKASLKNQGSLDRKFKHWYY